MSNDGSYLLDRERRHGCSTHRLQHSPHFTQRKLLDSIVAWQGATELFRERLGYDASGSVTSRTWQQSAAWPPGPTTEQYAYDGVGRLSAWWVGADTTRYDYDRWGNRIGWANTATATTGVGSYGNGTPNRLSSTVTLDQFNTAVDGPNTASFDASGSTTARSQFDPGTGITRSETFGYSWRDLTRRYLAAPPGSPALTPANDWRYRYSMSAEREQKRMYSWRQLNDTVTHSRAWVYYALGLGKEQLAVYNGLEVAMTMPKPFCDELMPDRVYLYPTEYNTYGNGALAVTTRPDATSSSGVKEYRVADALGSTRVVMTATTIAESDYLPFGQPVTGLTVGPSARTTYIGREVDVESAIGDFGFRRYDDGDGRFLSADPLWSMAPGVSPYVYCENDPVNFSDPLGLVGSTPISYEGPDPTPAGLIEDRLNRQRELNARQLRGPALSNGVEGPLGARNDRTASQPDYTKGGDSPGTPPLVASTSSGTGSLLNGVPPGLRPQPEVLPGEGGGGGGGGALIFYLVKMFIDRWMQRAAIGAFLPRIGDKLQYLFGQAQGDKNAQRTADMLRQLQSIGLYDRPEVRQYISQELTAVYMYQSGLVQSNGTVVRESLLVGPYGLLKLQSVWRGPKLETFFLYGRALDW